MFYFTIKSPRTSVLASSSLLDSDVLVKYEVSYLVTVIIELTFRECAGNTPVDSILILICAYNCWWNQTEQFNTIVYVTLDGSNFWIAWSKHPAPLLPKNLLLISRTLYVPKPLIPRSQTTVQLYPLILRQFLRSYGL